VVVSDSDCYDIVFLALARNCADTLPGVVRGLNVLHQSGMNVMAVVGENGSSDRTRELLEEAAASTGMVTVVDTSFMSPSKHERLQRMALGRQFLADYVREMPLPTRAIGVLDVDEPFLENLSPAALDSALQRVIDDDEVFAVSATSRPTYYDLLAFEDEDRSFVDLDKRILRAQRNLLEYYSFFRNVVYPEQQRLTSDFDRRCLSAFNGLCLYKSEIYARGSYLPPGDSPWICEHITFNRSIAADTGRHMVVDGALVLRMPPEHGRRTLPGFLWQRMSKLSKFVTASRGRS
jgi:hypothetical protein